MIAHDLLRAGKNGLMPCATPEKSFTICTNCLAPTAPFVSGGTNAKPNRLRLSCALCPSKFRKAVRRSHALKNTSGCQFPSYDLEER